MKIYKILIPNNFVRFDEFCERLCDVGQFSLNSQYIILLAEREKIDAIENDYELEFKEVLDFTTDIENLSIRKWIAQELYNHAQKIIKEEAQERINAMHDILKNANEIIKKGGIGESGNANKKESDNN